MLGPPDLRATAISDQHPDLFDAGPTISGVRWRTALAAKPDSEEFSPFPCRTSLLKSVVRNLIALRLGELCDISRLRRRVDQQAATLSDPLVIVAPLTTPAACSPCLPARRCAGGSSAAAVRRAAPHAQRAYHRHPPAARSATFTIKVCSRPGPGRRHRRRPDLRYPPRHPLRLYPLNRGAFGQASGVTYGPGTHPSVASRSRSGPRSLVITAAVIPLSRNRRPASRSRHHAINDQPSREP
jgi:hypothetical protein